MCSRIIYRALAGTSVVSLSAYLISMLAIPPPSSLTLSSPNTIEFLNPDLTYPWLPSGQVFDVSASVSAPAAPGIYSALPSTPEFANIRTTTMVVSFPLRIAFYTLVISISIGVVLWSAHVSRLAYRKITKSTFVRHCAKGIEWIDDLISTCSHNIADQITLHLFGAIDNFIASTFMAVTWCTASTNKIAHYAAGVFTRLAEPTWSRVSVAFPKVFHHYTAVLRNTWNLFVDCLALACVLTARIDSIRFAANLAFISTILVLVSSAIGTAAVSFGIVCVPSRLQCWFRHSRILSFAAWLGNGIRLAARFLVHQVPTLVWNVVMYQTLLIMNTWSTSVKILDFYVQLVHTARRAFRTVRQRAWEFCVHARGFSLMVRDLAHISVWCLVFVVRLIIVWSFGLAWHALKSAGLDFEEGAAPEIRQTPEGLAL